MHGNLAKEEKGKNSRAQNAHKRLPNRVNAVIEMLVLKKVLPDDGLVALGAEAHAQIILKRRQTIFALRSP